MSDQPKPPPPAISGSIRKPQPNGWWSIPGHKFDGSREGVLRALESATFRHLVEGKEVEEAIPKRWLDAIIADIAELPPEYNHVTLDAHACIGASPDPEKRVMKRTYALGITGSIKL